MHQRVAQWRRAPPGKTHAYLAKRISDSSCWGCIKSGNFWGMSELSLVEPERLGAQPSLLRKWEGSGGIWASSSNPDSPSPLVIVLLLQVFLPFCLILLTSPFLPLAPVYFSVKSIACFSSQATRGECRNQATTSRGLLTLMSPCSL